MSGHSHWAGIKHQKGINDAKRAKVFTKLARPIVIAARDGGSNPDTNFKLRLAIDKAREYNMPRENIDRAIARGAGSIKDGIQIEELVYEAFGPGNVAIIIKASTENKNRTVGDIKTTLTKNGGKFVPAGSISFLFREVGEIAVACTSQKQDDIELIAIEAGADDTEFDKNEAVLFVYTSISDLQSVRESLEKNNLSIQASEIVYRPTERIVLSDTEHDSLDALLEKLDDLDDVDAVYDNAE